MTQYQPYYDTFDRHAQDRIVPAARMNVSPSVFLPNSEIDFATGQLKPDRQRRRRTQGKRLEAERREREQKRLEEAVQREMNKGGVRITMRAGEVCAYRAAKRSISMPTVAANSTMLSQFCKFRIRCFDVVSAKVSCKLSSP